MTIIETAELCGLDPQSYLADVFARINDYKNNRLQEVLPCNWKPVVNSSESEIAFYIIGDVNDVNKNHHI